MISDFKVSCGVNMIKSLTDTIYRWCNNFYTHKPSKIFWLQC